MKRGPKSKSLIEKVAGKIAGSPDIATTLADFPVRVEPCWIWTGNDNQVISYGSSSKRVIRAMFEIGCSEPLHEAWRPHNLCGQRKCVNPTHYALRPHKLNRYSGMVPLPRKLRPTMTAEEAAAEIAKMDPVEEVIEMIDEHWPRPTPEEFRAKMAELAIRFEDGLIETAYERISKNAW